MYEYEKSWGQQKLWGQKIMGSGNLFPRKINRFSAGHLKKKTGNRLLPFLFKKRA